MQHDPVGSDHSNYSYGNTNFTRTHLLVVFSASLLRPDCESAKQLVSHNHFEVRKGIFLYDCVNSRGAGGACVASQPAKQCIARRARQEGWLAGAGECVAPPRAKQATQPACIAAPFACAPGTAPRQTEATAERTGC